MDIPVVVCRHHAESHEMLAPSAWGSDRRTSYVIKPRAPRPDEGRILNQDSSNESLVTGGGGGGGGGGASASAGGGGFIGSRLRKISGNISEGTSSTGSDVRFLRMRSGGGGGMDEDKASSSYAAAVDDRVVFVSAERKVPFAIGSVIIFAKGSKNPHRLVSSQSVDCTSSMQMAQILTCA